MQRIRYDELAPGDALYIPEGWWHQVDSDAHTAAVNFWWESDFARGLGGDMDAYYARKSMESLARLYNANAVDPQLESALVSILEPIKSESNFLVAKISFLEFHLVPLQPGGERKEEGDSCARARGGAAVGSVRGGRYER
jgi:hypothetical protein